MATSRILLPVKDADLPTSNPAVRPAPPGITSSAVATANTPKPTYQQLQYNQSTDQFAMWTFRMPADYQSGGLVVVKLGAAVNAGNVVMSGGIDPSVDGSTLFPASVFNACDVSVATAVPASIGQTLDLSWALTMTQVQGSRLCTVFIGRRASIAGDTAAGDAYVLAAGFEYTS
jgi:hypothetical protein